MNDSDKRIDIDLDFLNKPRGVTFSWHMAQVNEWLNFDAGNELDNVLVYASLELRCAIERYIFELLYFLKGKELTRKEEIKCRSIKGLFALMKEADPHYRKTALFTSIATGLVPGSPKVVVADTGLLRRKWEELSEYCHKQIRPNESFSSPDRSFQEKGFSLIREVVEYLNQWELSQTTGILQPDTMPASVKAVYDDFIIGKITEEQALQRLKIVEPLDFLDI